MLMQRPESLADISSEDLHVARQHHQIGSGLPDELPDRGFLLVFGLPGHRQMVKRNVTEIEAAVSLARMIGDDRGGNHLQLAGSPAVEDIGEAMVGSGDQQHHPLTGSAVAHPPLHLEAVRDRAESGLQSRQRDRKIGRGEHDPHEEMAGFDVVELLGVENVLPVMGEERRNGGNDARPVGA